MNKKLYAPTFLFLVLFQCATLLQGQRKMDSLSFRSLSFQVIDESYILAVANGGIIDVVNRLWYLEAPGNTIILSFAYHTASNVLFTIERGFNKKNTLVVRSYDAKGNISKDTIHLEKEIVKELIADESEVFIVSQKDDSSFMYKCDAIGNIKIAIRVQGNVSSIAYDKEHNGYFFSIESHIYKKVENKGIIKIYTGTDDIEKLKFSNGDLYASNSAGIFLIRSGMEELINKQTGYFDISSSKMYYWVGPFEIKSIPL